ncbi:GNAT family N-acetyltransferase [Nocardia pseudobrasiliensis]|uniref:GNAT family N-acetyltransferase n=1 Tax=Nocardia pseudobrasiliensis TaxID=45979 RepID=UPI001B866171|nr:GNAT family N-acetyltransferase [Nocardia pseudobrasiliensis]
MTDEITIRTLDTADPRTISAAFTALGWIKPLELYLRYLAEQRANRRICLVAERSGAFAGYCTLVWESSYAPFRAEGIPEISDLNVLPEYRDRGIGTRLLDTIEELARARGERIGIGVGLTADYGAAQRLYCRRGYLPDGRGIVHGDRPVTPGESITVDDDAVLMMIREFTTPAAGPATS